MPNITSNVPNKATTVPRTTPDNSGVAHTAASSCPTCRRRTTRTRSRSSSRRPTRVSFGQYKLLSPDVMNAVRQRQPRQLEPRSRYSVTLCAPAKPRNPAYPQPLYLSSTDGDFRPTRGGPGSDLSGHSADRRALVSLDRRQPTLRAASRSVTPTTVDAEFLRVWGSRVV